MEVPRLSIYVGMPSHSLLRLPDRLPAVLPDIRQNVTTGKWPTDPKFYNYTLDVRFPFLWALSYMISVIFLNQVNRRRQNKPWAVSRFRAFKTFVLAHNVFLALLSAWVLLSTCKVIRGQAPAPDEDNYLVHVVDRLCRTEDLMEIERLGHHSSWNNDLTHVHEVWYIAWIFYLLKFYEVLDTAIILASGKEASLLQTYHHTGVMICAWASLRFVAPSAFSVLLLNSGIHTFMVRFSFLIFCPFSVLVFFYFYFYFLFRRNQTLTSLQIVHILRSNCPSSSFAGCYQENPHLDANGAVCSRSVGGVLLSIHQI
jgi:hypothetical protein